MNFLNEEHEANFEKVRAIGHYYNDDVGYNRAMLLLTLPFIFRKFEKDFYNYRENGSPLDIVFDTLQAEEGERKIDLTGSMKLISTLALNLFNGFGKVSIYSILSTCEERYIQVIVDAIQLKKSDL